MATTKTTETNYCTAFFDIRWDISLLKIDLSLKNPELAKELEAILEKHKK